ncbi:hypothetical protein [Peribacillus sp. CSMR9]|nr:hypothetical protein [Peribacillus sp. CSMR9]MDV7765961.1 hypothetical protein [Peribacillus sp. CSMR9]
MKSGNTPLTVIFFNQSDRGKNGKVKMFDQKGSNEKKPHQIA